MAGAARTGRCTGGRQWMFAGGRSFPAPLVPLCVGGHSFAPPGRCGRGNASCRGATRQL